MQQKTELISFYQWITKRSNLDLFTCSSWLQKSIRRGLLEDSLNYTKELIESNQLNYLWKRIFVIMIEDIWLANLHLTKIINKLYKNYLKSETDTLFEEKFIYQAIVLLVISPKSRENDNFYHYIKTFKKGTEEELSFFNKFCSPYFYEKNNKKINQELKESLDLFFKNQINKDLLDICIENILILKNLNGKSELNLHFINLFLVLKYNIQIDFSLNWIEENKNLIPEKLNLATLPKINPKDYVYDKHTKIWKEKGRDDNHFFKEGCLLNNEVKVGENIYSDFIKENIKK